MKERGLTLTEQDVLKELNEKCIKAGNEILYKIIKNDDDRITNDPDNITWDLGKIHTSSLGFFNTNTFGLLQDEIPILYGTENLDFKTNLTNKIKLWESLYPSVTSLYRRPFGIIFTNESIRISGENYRDANTEQTTLKLNFDPPITEKDFKNLLCKYYQEKKLYDIPVDNIKYKKKFMK